MYLTKMVDLFLNNKLHFDELNPILLDNENNRKKIQNRMKSFEVICNLRFPKFSKELIDKLCYYEDGCEFSVMSTIFKYFPLLIVLFKSKYMSNVSRVCKYEFELENLSCDMETDIDTMNDCSLSRFGYSFGNYVFIRKMFEKEGIYLDYSKHYIDKCFHTYGLYKNWFELGSIECLGVIDKKLLSLEILRSNCWMQPIYCTFLARHLPIDFLKPFIIISKHSILHYHVIIITRFLRIALLKIKIKRLICSHKYRYSSKRIKLT